MELIDTFFCVRDQLQVYAQKWFLKIEETKVWSTNYDVKLDTIN